MINKYIVDGKEIFISFFSGDYIRSKYKGIDIKESWHSYIIDSNKLIAPFYFEIKKDSNKLLDLDLVFKDTLKTIEFIKSEFNIESESLRLYFNGVDGIYICIPSAVTGVEFSGAKSGNKINYRIAKYINENTDIKLLREDIYSCSEVHATFNTKDKNTNLYVKTLSEDMIRNNATEDIISYAKEQRSKYYNKCRICRVKCFKEEFKQFLNEDDINDIEGILEWKNGQIFANGINIDAVEEFKHSEINSLFMQELIINYNSLPRVKDNYSDREVMKEHEKAFTELIADGLLRLANLKNIELFKLDDFNIKSWPKFYIFNKELLSVLVINKAGVFSENLNLKFEKKMLEFSINDFLEIIVTCINSLDS